MKSDHTTRIKQYLATLKLNRIAAALDEELSRASREATSDVILTKRPGTSRECSTGFGY